MESGRMEDRSVFSASGGSLPLSACFGKQHLCEAHFHGAKRAIYQALQEKGVFSVLACKTQIIELSIFLWMQQLMVYLLKRLHACTFCQLPCYCSCQSSLQVC